MSDAKAPVEERSGDDPKPRTEPEHADLRSPVSWLPTVVETVAAVVIALLIGAVLIALSDRRVVEAIPYLFSYPQDFFGRSWDAISSSYSALVTGSLGSTSAISTTLERSAPLICAGLGVSLAFRAGLFNIGAQGQLIIGALLCGYVGFGWSLPGGLHLLVALAAGLLGGAIWGGIAGLLKARTGAHEVITTIMLNFLAASVLLYALSKETFQRPGSDNRLSPPVSESSRFPLALDTHLGVILAFLAAVGVWWLLERSTLGFELRAVGVNPDASRTAGMSVPKVYTLAMVIAGALAGLAATMNVLGRADSLSPTMAGTIGFDAITVALLGRATPLGTVLSGLLFGALSVGGVAMQASAASTPQGELTQVLSALIVLFVAAPALVRGITRLKASSSGGAMMAKGWGLLMATAVAATGLVEVRDRASVARQVKLVVVFAIVTLLLLWFALATDSPTVLYTLGERITQETPAQEVNGQVLAWGALVVAAVALALAALDRVPRGGWGVLVFALVGLAFFTGFLVWNYADQSLARPLAMVNPLPGTMRLATPLVLGALAGCLCERAGVINIAIEGQLLMGAFFAAVASSLFYSAEMGLVGGMLAGLGMAWMLGVFALRYQVNQVVLGVVLIAFATGLTAFLLSQIPNDPAIKQYLNEPLVLERIAIPGLSSVPILGPTLFDQTLLVYLMYVSVVVVTFLLFQTKWGLRVRAVGEHPKAADTVGIKVNRVRWQAVLFGGLFADLGGAYFTVGSTGSFDNDASAGNGFIALAAVIMGRWHPIGATLAALFFGFTWTLQAQLQVLDKIPGELLRASPYLATIIAVAGFVGRVRPPAADGEPYVKS